MHELSIAQNIIEIAIKECTKAGCNKINSISMRIGKASGVMIDALLFAFDIVKKDSIAEGAVLHYEEIPVKGRCRECGIESSVDDSIFFCCPRCGSYQFELLSGRELDIIEIDVE
jgi:hydrogenase nickel incorporation protein HypA/HybF